MLIPRKKIPGGSANVPSGFLQKIFYLLFFESTFCSLFMSPRGLPSISGLCKLLSDCAKPPQRAVHRVRVA